MYENWTVWILAIMAGGLGSFINQAIKKLTEWTGLPAFTVSSLLSIALAAIILLIAGKFHVSDWATTSAAVFSVSQVIFRFLLSNDRPVVAENVPLADAK